MIPRPDHISPHQWDMMTDAEQREEWALLANEADIPARVAPPQPRPGQPRAIKQRWRVVKPATVREAFQYDPETGCVYKVVVRRCVSHNMPDQVLVDPRPAGSPHLSECLVIRHGGRLWYVHRLAWLLMTGEEPRGQIRHRNGNRRDNRWENLELFVNSA